MNSGYINLFSTGWTGWISDSLKAFSNISARQPIIDRRSYDKAIAL